MSNKNDWELDEETIDKLEAYLGERRQKNDGFAMLAGKWRDILLLAKTDEERVTAALGILKDANESAREALGLASSMLDEVQGRLMSYVEEVVAVWEGLGIEFEEEE